MRFKSTLVLLIICLLFGGYLYFYEIKGGEQRDKNKEAEKLIWKIEPKDVQQIDLQAQGQHIAARRQGDTRWELTSPGTLEADSDELNRLISSASNIQRETVVEQNAADLGKFGLSPAQSTLKLKTKEGKEYAVDFGSANPTGSSVYAALAGKKEVFLVSKASVDSFQKKPDDLRNQMVLSFDQPEAQSLSIRSAKGDLELSKDGNDRWWIVGKERIAADSPEIRGILNALSMGRVKGFFNDSPETYRTLGLENPLVEVKIGIGKNRAIKHLLIGLEKSNLRRKSGGEQENGPESSSEQLYLAKDESRPDLFFVEKALVEKLTKSPNDVKDKALAAFQRWDVDYISVTNSKGSFAFIKSGGEWFLSNSKKKAKWEPVNAILDTMEKPVREWIDKPAPLPVYGLEKPAIHVVLKQGGTVLADASFGKSAKDGGIYALIKGDSSVKVADPEGIGNLDKGEADYLEQSQDRPVKSGK